MMDAVNKPIFRVAGHEDLDSIMMLETEAFSRGWSKPSWAEEIHEHYVALGYSDYGMGVIAMSTVAGIAELRRIIVAPEARGRGLGHDLVSHGLEWAERFGTTEVFLEVAADNPAAIGLYESSGFTLLDRRADYYGPGADALVYRRVIPLIDPVILAAADVIQPPSDVIQSPTDVILTQSGSPSQQGTDPSTTPEETSCPNR